MLIVVIVSWVGPAFCLRLLPQPVYAHFRWLPARLAARGLRFLDVAAARPLLCRSGFGALRDIRSVTCLEAVTRAADGLRAKFLEQLPGVWAIGHELAPGNMCIL